MARSTHPRIIGTDADGAPIWASAGGRGTSHGIGGIDFAVDDRDGDEPDDFDGDDDGDDGDEYEIDDRDDRDEDDEDDDRETGDEDDEDDPRDRRRRDRQQDRWEPPSREEWEKLQEAQRRNNGELQRNREARKILQRLNLRTASEFADFLLDRGFDPDTGSRLGDAAEDADTEERRQEAAVAHRRAEQRGAEREASRYRPAIVQFAAADAFRDAGFSGSSLNRVLRLLDTDSVDVEFDEHGEVVVYGLDDQVKTIKDDLPELFRPRRDPGRRRGEQTEQEPERRPARPREGGRRVGMAGARAVDGGERGRPAPTKIGWLEKTDRAMRGLPPEPRGRRR